MAESSASLVVRIVADIDSFKRGMSEAEREIVKTGARLQSLGKSLTLGITAPFLALGAVMAKAAAEEEASVKKLQHTFGSSASAMESFVQSLTKTIPVADDELRQLVSSTDVFFRSMGVGASQAASMTRAVTTLAGDLAAFNHVTVEAASGALQSALAGRTRGLRELNIVISDADVKQRAYSLGLAKTGEELSTLAKSQATWSLILERSKQQQGEAARTINDDANALARLKQASTETAESFGKLFLPAAAKIVNTLSGLLRGLNELSPSTKGVIVGIGGITAIIGPAIFIIGSLTEKVALLTRALTVLGGGSALAGLGKFAASVGPWGLLIGAALTAIALDLKATGDRAKDAADNLAKYKASLDLLAASGQKGPLTQQLLAMQSELQALQKQRESLLRQKAALAAQPKAAGEFDNVLTRGVPSTAMADLNAKLKAVDDQTAALRPKFDAVTQAIVGMNTAAGGGTPGEESPLAKMVKDASERAQAVIDAFNLMKDGFGPIPGFANALALSLAEVDALAAKIPNRFDPLRLKLEQIGQTIRNEIIAPLTTLVTSGPLGGVQVARPSVIGAGFIPGPPGGPPFVPVGGKPGPGQVNIGGITMKAPEIAQIPPKLDKGFSEITHATIVGFQQVALAIGDTLAQNLTAALGGRGIGAQIGGALGGAFGGGFGTVIGQGVAGSVAGALGGTALGSALGGAIGSVIPVAGTIVGTILGGAIGGLFGHHKKKVDQSAQSLDNLSKAADRLTASISNIPNFFKLEYYRYLAAPVNPATPNTPPMPYTPPPGTEPGQIIPEPNAPPGQITPNRIPAGAAIVVYGDVHVNNPVANAKDLLKGIAEATLKRAGTGSRSRLALAGVNL